MLFTSKKAMSPLIATVLLIAFAVALGAMIMNWSAGVEPDIGSGSVNCDSVSLSNAGSVCYGNTSLSFNLRNDGDARIDAVKLIITDDFGTTQTTIRDSALIAGETIQREKPYVYNDGTVKLEFIPLLGDKEGNFQSCDTKGFSQEVLSDC